MPDIPDELSLLLLNIVAYPMTVILISSRKASSWIGRCLDGWGGGMLVALKNLMSAPTPSRPTTFLPHRLRFTVHRLKMPDGTRASPSLYRAHRNRRDPVLVSHAYSARIRVAPDTVEEGIEIEALMRNLGDWSPRLRSCAAVPRGSGNRCSNEDDSRRLAYLLALSCGAWGSPILEAKPAYAASLRAVGRAVAARNASAPGGATDPGSGHEKCPNAA